jgi:hypothetical protein
MGLDFRQYGRPAGHLIGAAEQRNGLAGVSVLVEGLFRDKGRIRSGYWSLPDLLLDVEPRPNLGLIEGVDGERHTVCPDAVSVALDKRTGHIAALAACLVFELLVEAGKRVLDLGARSKEPW